ncbi:MAG: GspE/PulE family protein, partial [Fidelibacterota bacterium]
MNSDKIEEIVNKTGMEILDVSKIDALEPGILNFIQEDIAYRFKAVPIARKNGFLKVAMANPFDVVAIDVIQEKSLLPIERVYTPEKEIEKFIERIYSQKTNIEKSLQEIVDFEVEEEEEEEESDVELLKIQAQDAPAIKFVNLVLLQAVQERASDIHIEPHEKDIKVRIRVDGILREITPPPKKLQSGIISRIKILGDLDIAEKRVPQDGRTKVKILGRSIDIRISTLPTIYGEKVVMRILDKGSRSLTLDDLGFDKKSLISLKKILKMPYGLILVTGPTGSGKTTTLYSALNYITSPEKNIVTIEDPVEYRLKGINQVQVKPQVGLTFASGLRTILRQDPDIVMVGEIR